MCQAGDCDDSALAERIFATLKGELIDTRLWPTRGVPRRATFEWIAIFYNRQRYHSALAYQGPITFGEVPVTCISRPSPHLSMRVA